MAASKQKATAPLAAKGDGANGCCRANSAHVRQSELESGFDVQKQILRIFELFHFRSAAFSTPVVGTRPREVDGSICYVVTVSSRETDTFRGRAGAFAGGWPDELRGKVFWLFPGLVTSRLVSRTILFSKKSRPKIPDLWKGGEYAAGGQKIVMEWANIFSE